MMLRDRALFGCDTWDAFIGLMAIIYGLTAATILVGAMSP